MHTNLTNDWLKQLSDAEVAYWHEKPLSEKDWWATNTKPEDRPKLLRTEIEVKKTSARIRRLPKDQRDAIYRKIDEDAEAARERLRKRGLLPPKTDVLPSEPSSP